MMNSIQQVLSQLEQPDQHIPKVNIVGIDASELEETISLFRSIVFSGYFDCRPLGETLLVLWRLLQDKQPEPIECCPVVMLFLLKNLVVG